MGASRDDAYVEYVTARLPALHRAAFLLCGGDAHRADDVVQETITRLYQRWRQASRAENLDAYVHRMLVHVFVDEKRLRWARVKLLPWVGDATAEATPGAPLEERSQLVAALRQLPARQRAAIVMRFLLDRSIEEVAEALGCSTGTVKSQTSRGLTALRHLIPAPSDIR